MSPVGQARERAASWCCFLPRRAGKRDQDSPEDIYLQEEPLSLDEESWFHGRLAREGAESCLLRDGDFLLRETFFLGEWRLALSARWAGQHRHFVLQRAPQGGWYSSGRAFSSVQRLVEFHVQTGTPLDEHWAAVLRRPISPWLLHAEELDIGQLLGQGEYGAVYLGLLRRTGCAVAIKMSPENVPCEYQRMQLEEGRLLRRLQHPNIVSFIGMCQDRDSVMIVMEYVSGGSLLKFLREHRLMLVPRQLVAMCVDVAHGMRYLETMKCVHRDLAARNCLKGDVVKISDFGMSREVEQYYRSAHQTSVPLKWMAPESLTEAKYSSKSDVWSFGVLVWEIFSRGSEPYSGMKNWDAVSKVMLGYRMLPTPDMPPALASLMSECWRVNVHLRPNFQRVVEVVEEVLLQYQS